MEGKQDRKMWLCWGRRRDWKWELRDSSCLVHLYSGNLFFMDDNLETLQFPCGAVQKEGALEYPARSRVQGLCRDSTLSYLLRKRSFLFSEVHFRTGMNPFPGGASAQRRLRRNIPQNGGDQPGWADNTLTSGRQRCCPLGRLQSALGQILWSRPRNCGPGSDQPSQATPGAGEDLWSHFLSTLASFFTSLKISYFHHNQFLFSPAAVVVSPQTELWSTSVAATWTVPAAETDPISPELKGFFIPDKIAERRN